MGALFTLEGLEFRDSATWIDAGSERVSGILCRKRRARMKSGTHQSDNEQKIFHSELFHAVEQINEADDLLRKNSASDLASNRATALLLSAIARVLVVEAAAQHDMSTSLLNSYI